MPELGNDALDQSGSFGDPPENPLDEYESDEESGEESTPDPSVQPVDSDGPQTETLKKFADTYHVAEEDVGMTPQEIYDELNEGTDREPNETDEEILDALLSPDGSYRHQFDLGPTEFTLQTVTPAVKENIVPALREVFGEEGPSSRSVEGVILVSQHLYSYGGERTFSGAFESVEGLASRINTCMNIPAPIHDRIGERVNAFRNRVEDALQRSVANF